MNKEDKKNLVEELYDVRLLKAKYTKKEAEIKKALIGTFTEDELTNGFTDADTNLAYKISTQSPKYTDALMQLSMELGPKFLKIEESVTSSGVKQKIVGGLIYDKAASLAGTIKTLKILDPKIYKK